MTRRGEGTAARETSGGGQARGHEGKGGRGRHEMDWKNERMQEKRNEEERKVQKRRVEWFERVGDGTETGKKGKDAGRK